MMSEESSVKEKKHMLKRREKDVTAGKPKKKRKWIAVLVVIVIIIAVLSSAVKNMTAQVEMAMNMVEIEPVQYRDLSDSISIKGTVSGESRTNVVSVASAEVTAVNVQVGDIVTTGDPLVTLDRSDIEKQIADTTTSMTNAQALAKNQTSLTAQGLAEAKEDQSVALTRAAEAVEEAQADYDEIKKKCDECSSNLEKKSSALSAADSTLKSALNELNAAKANYQSAESAYSQNQGEEALREAYNAAAGELESKEAAYSNAVNSYASLEAEVAALKAEAESYPAMLKSAQSAIDAANTNYEDMLTSTNRSVASAQNQVDMLKYQSNDSSVLSEQLDELNKQLADCELTAPCSGVVIAVNVSVGDKYAAGQTMVTIEDTSSMKVIVTVEEADILKIEEGMNAIITTDATGEEEISGTVTRVVRVKNQSASAVETGTSGGYSAEITIDNTQLLVGMSAKAKIVLKEKGNVLAVPYDLIQYDENGAAFVLVAKANEDGTATAVRKNITVGEEVDYYTEITGGDLKEGDQLIYDYTYSIAEGQIFTPEQMYSEQNLGFGNTGVEAE